MRAENKPFYKQYEGVTDKMADSIGTKEAAEKWGYKQATITKWCRENKIPGAEQDEKGSPWRIPKDAECPRKMKSKQPL